jgi:hypothetical protein
MDSSTNLMGPFLYCKYKDILLYWCIHRNKGHPIEALCFQVSGKDPGYGLTGMILLLSAVTILRENDKMPGR